MCVCQVILRNKILQKFSKPHLHLSYQSQAAHSVAQYRKGQGKKLKAYNQFLINAHNDYQLKSLKVL